MPETITKEDGSEVEVFTQEELETQSQSAIDKYKEENPIDNTELEEVKEKLQKAEDKEINFAKLRKIAEEKGIKLDEKDTELEEKDKEFSKFQEDTKSELDNLRSEMTAGKRTEAINKLSDDPEERKKIKFNLDRLSKSDDNQETFEINLLDAYKLTTKQEVQTTDYISNTGAGNGTEKEKVTANEIELGNALGITEEDRKKYSK